MSHYKDLALLNIMPNDFYMVLKHVGWDSVVSIAPCLNGLGNESRLGQDFLHISISPLGPSVLYNGYCFLPGGKAAGVWH
jgi:hypothetical protein